MLAPDTLMCPGCQALVHADTLKQLAAEASEATRGGDRTAALTAWRRALDYLPAGTVQHEGVLSRIRALSTEISNGSPAGSAAAPVPAKQASRLPKPLAALGGLGVFIWKAKFLAVLALTKGKLLLLGLTKMSTLLSMALTFGIYWRLFGWAFALGLVVTTYIHEMGHVASLRRYGIPATAPMFIPGFGALVRIDQYPVTATEDARVGLAGPIWGAAAAVGCLILFWTTGAKTFAATAVVTSWINLFNLMPIFTLDGGRGFRALSRQFRLIVGVVAVAAAFWAHESGMLLFVGGLALLRALGRDAPAEGDQTALLTFITLIAVLSSVLVLYGDPANPTKLLLPSGGGGG
jgi:Zn-dependent protease